MKKIVSLMFILIPLAWFIGCGSGKSEGKQTNTKESDANAQNSNKNEETGKKSGKPVGPGDSAIPVEVTPVTRGSISSFLLYNSTLETEQMADVYPKISGVAEEIYAEEGDQVLKDQPLLQIEQDEYILAEEKARLDYDKQKSEFERFNALKNQDLVSEEEFETARLSVRQAELEWKRAKLNLDYTIVRSPINGVVGDRSVKVGDRIQTSSKLFVISNPKEKVAKVYVPQNELPNTYKNQKAEITSDVLPNKSFEGWVKRVSPIVDPTSGTFKVTVGVKDHENMLAPGMFMGVKLIVDVHENTKLIPKSGLVYENERTYFFQVSSDSVIRRELKKGFEDAEKVELLNDISDTTKIVVVGQGGLKDGNKVKVIEERHYSWQNLESQKIASAADKKREDQITKQPESVQ